MILVQDTIRKFGYDPTLIGPTTGKKIVRKCEGCGAIGVTTRQSADRMCHSCGKKKAWVGHKALAAADPAKRFWIRSKGQTKRLECHCGAVEEVASVSRILCLGCSREKAKAIIEDLKKLQPACVLLAQETIDAFGYDPTTLSKWSRLPIMRQCGGCHEVQQVRMDHVERLCPSCGSHLDQKRKSIAYQSLGLTPQGNDPALLKEKSNAWRRAFDANRKVSEVGRLRGILYATVGQMVNGTISVSRNLPYTAGQLREHIEEEIVKFGCDCPMCGADLTKSGYDIDHKVPTSSAKTVEEMQALFALSNLSVLCPDCNRRIKKAKTVAYDEIKKINKEAVVAVVVNG